jgi:hypothetical protein|uniref:Uncharacterized protein n=1 Tax=Picea glauca TaxID=3330 RepID=A0A117NFR4_PICGL|nr:hypothetical protein ABT39_MTgene2397 [Picea glauca]
MYVGGVKERGEKINALLGVMPMILLIGRSVFRRPINRMRELLNAAGVSVEPAPIAPIQIARTSEPTSLPFIELSVAVYPVKALPLVKVISSFRLRLC